MIVGYCVNNFNDIYCESCYTGDKNKITEDELIREGDNFDEIPYCCDCGEELEGAYEHEEGENENE
ncbi:TPA: hypothetical protein RIO42_005689 [Bacillus anthracis]|nr:hypothetical protein [Bacillus anthracis]